MTALGSDPEISLEDGSAHLSQRFPALGGGWSRPSSCQRWELECGAVKGERRVQSGCAVCRGLQNSRGVLKPASCYDHPWSFEEILMTDKKTC